ncbi:putative membrane protein [Crossiella equi]|uniref:Membrane protein n=1 Tax=Crossiella equi TaxID=130796 RepID=A0ABS5A9U9_9PSEU|nr:hypothetical protein [Crossiella equi]MBP2473369.1 putative membrane protein [Crossiella equi]
MRVTLEVFGWIALINGGGSFISRQMTGNDWFLMSIFKDFQPAANIVVALIGVVLLVASFSMKKQAVRS